MGRERVRERVLRHDRHARSAAIVTRLGDRQSGCPRSRASVSITVMCARLVTYAINGLFEIDRPGGRAARARAVSLASSSVFSAQRFVDKEPLCRLLRHQAY